MRAVRQVNHLLAERAEELKAAASTDALTGLCNRHGALPLLDALQNDAAARIAVLVIDVDHFKQVNDRHGHAAGDAVLVIIARRLERVLPGSWRLARWGGEEFIAFGPVDSPQDAGVIAEALRQAVRDHPVRTTTIELPVSISIGVALRQDDLRRPWEALVHAADQALYRAKHAGRDRIEYATPALPDQA
jgi:diguanylate cyclase (GGDEF)-like protein